MGLHDQAASPATAQPGPQVSGMPAQPRRSRMRASCSAVRQGGADHLVPSEPNHLPAVSDVIEVPIGVAAAAVERRMSEPAVQLDGQTTRIGHVAVLPSGRAGAHDLARSERKAVRPLDPGEVGVLEDGAGSGREILEQSAQPPSTWHPRPGGEGRAQPRDRGAPAADRVRQEAHGRQLVGRLLDEVEHRHLVAESRR